jgi:hypothetical protein
VRLAAIRSEFVVLSGTTTISFRAVLEPPVGVACPGCAAGRAPPAAPRPVVDTRPASRMKSSRVCESSSASTFSRL